MTTNDFEAVIGLEVHVQLATESKIFSRAQAKQPEGTSLTEEKANHNVTPVCVGHPGTLPVLNRRTVEFAIKAGLATNCEIRRKSVFSRKHYFYPDLPKGYQISQYDQPLCEKGWLMVYPKGAEPRKIRITRIHMEEDAGKNIHMSGFSLINFNRAGVPLIEVVSEPDMRTAEEAGAYLRALYSVVTYLGICDGNLQEGNFRCDVNLSIRPRGQEAFGTRTEIKNVNSFRFVEKAIEHEMARQIEVVNAGGKIIQETRLYDSAKNVTVSMRTKEDAQDYRYFPDPDLSPLIVSETWIEELRRTLPELPEAKRARYCSDYGLSEYDSGVLTQNKKLAAVFEASLSLLTKKGIEEKAGAKVLANYLAGEVSRLMNEESIEIDQSKLGAQHLADLVPMLVADELSSTNAKVVISEIWKTGQTVAQVVESKGLRQVSDVGALEPIVAQVMTANAGQVADFRAGKEKLMGFFVGQCMKASRGQGNPKLFQDILEKKLRGK